MICNHLKIGDVFRLPKSQDLSYETTNEGSKTILDKTHLTPDDGMNIHWTEIQTKPGGWTREVERQTDTSISPKDLPNGEWVVEEARLTGGGTGHGPGDVYPDGWHITARLLRPNGTYDPKGVTLQFYQDGCFTTVIEGCVKTRTLKMKRDFVE